MTVGKKLILGIVLFMTWVSCQQKEPHPYGFYYWRTELKLDSVESQALERSELEALYCRLFDIDKVNGEFQPIAVIRKDSVFQLHKKIVPVVFIKNEALHGITENEITFLAQETIRLITHKIEEFNWDVAAEIQIDCDWTKGTKTAFFQLLKALQKATYKTLTCTLRLHQVAEKETVGIPPVSKVYLMCYATSSPLEDENDNSILDIDILKKYLQNVDSYPLKMDVALPIYSWGIVTNHLGKHKLINGLMEKDMNPEVFRSKGNHKYEVKEEGFYFGIYLNKGFEIEIEEVSQSTLNETISFLEQKLIHFNIIYFQLEGKFIQKYNL